MQLRRLASTSGGGGGSGTVTSITGFDSVATSPGTITTTGTIALVNDSPTPGASQFYGTNSSGVKGWFSSTTLITGDPNEVLYFDDSGNVTSDINFTRQGAGGNFATTILATDGTSLSQQAYNAGTASLSVVGTGGESYSNNVDTITQKGTDFQYTSSGQRFGLALNNSGFTYLSGLQIGDNGAALFKIRNDGNNFIWPTVQSTGTQGLLNDGSGNLSWGASGLTSVAVTSPLTGDGTGGSPITMGLAQTHLYVGDGSNVATDAGSDFTYNPGTSTAVLTSGTLTLAGSNESLTTGNRISFEGGAPDNDISFHTTGGGFPGAIANALFLNSDIASGIAFTSAANANVLGVATAAGDWWFPFYPNTRDNSGVSTPVNFLYTGTDGHVLSAPLSAAGFLTSVSVTSPLAGNGTSGSPLAIVGTPTEVPYYDFTTGAQTSNSDFTYDTNAGIFNVSFGAGYGISLNNTLNQITIGNTASDNPALSLSGLGAGSSASLGADQNVTIQTLGSNLLSSVLDDPNDVYTLSDVAITQGMFVKFANGGLASPITQGLNMDFSGGQALYQLGNTIGQDGQLVLDAVNHTFSTTVFDATSGSSIELNSVSAQIDNQDIAGTYNANFAADSSHAGIAYQDLTGNIDSDFSATLDNALMRVFNGNNGLVSGIEAKSSSTDGLLLHNNDGTTNVTWKWPVTDGNLNNPIITNGSGVLSFANVNLPNNSSMLIGQTSGYISAPVVISGSETFLGFQAGNGMSTNNTVAIGVQAGDGSTNAVGSNFIGVNAGFNSPDLAFTIAIGSGAGANETINNTFGQTSILIGNSTGTGGFHYGVAIGDSAINTAVAQFLVDQPSHRFTNITLESLGTASLGDGLHVGNSTEFLVDDPNFNLILSGGVTFKQVDATSTYTVLQSDYYVDLDSGIGATLPSLGTVPLGKTYVLTDITGSGNQVISAFGTDTINGATSFTFTIPYQSITVHSSSLGWAIS